MVSEVAMDRISVNGKRFVDEYGRHRIFNGINYTDKNVKYCFINPNEYTELNILAAVIKRVCFHKHAAAKEI